MKNLFLIMILVLNVNTTLAGERVDDDGYDDPSPSSSDYGDETGYKPSYTPIFVTPTKTSCLDSQCKKSEYTFSNPIERCEFSPGDYCNSNGHVLQIYLDKKPLPPNTQLTCHAKDNKTYVCTQR